MLAQKLLRTEALIDDNEHQLSGVLHMLISRCIIGGATVLAGRSGSGSRRSASK